MPRYVPPASLILAEPIVICQCTRELVGKQHPIIGVIASDDGERACIVVHCHVCKVDVFIPLRRVE